ncbi:MAG: CopK family periplasmic copper-binding protein [Betaproteobacteria bacterium]|nr:CopK family periplasmic copper-binding protein [Betaproteobacteria bacterium]
MQGCFFLVFISAISAYAVEKIGEPLELKDGSYLFISEGDTMRMVDKDGKPVTMKDGVEMELKDGTLIMMKNKKVWRHDHRKMK